MSQYESVDSYHNSLKRYVLLKFGVGFFARGDVTIIFKLGNECETHHNRANTEHRTCQTPVKCSSPSSLTFDVSPVASNIPRYIPRSLMVKLPDGGLPGQVIL